jgi:methyl-accepting chemotaxis protein
MSNDKSLDNSNYSGLKSKILVSVFLSNLFIFILTLFFVCVFGSEVKSIVRYAIGMVIITLLLEMAIFYYIKKIQSKSSLVGIVFQQYIEKSQNTIEEFVYPKKNIAKSFDKQYDLINQTAAAISEISQVILKTTEQIHDCKEITQSTEKRLQDAVTVMEKLGQSIEVIKSATADMDKMLQIINQITLKSIVITDIVAKTELLAMNASIEAARAGEHGKGFSVVSEEVETLARTSGKSAKQIKDLLNESSIKVSQIIRTMNERIKEGEVVSKKAFDAFNRINEGVEQLKEQIQIIFEGTDMQTGVIKNVEESLKKVTEGIGQNNKLISNGNDSINQLIEINDKLIHFSEETQNTLSGIEGVKVMKMNKGNEVRRTLQGMGF